MPAVLKIGILRPQLLRRKAEGQDKYEKAVQVFINIDLNLRQSSLFARW